MKKKPTAPLQWNDVKFFPFSHLAPKLEDMRGTAAVCGGNKIWVIRIDPVEEKCRLLAEIIDKSSTVTVSGTRVDVQKCSIQYHGLSIRSLHNRFWPLEVSEELSSCTMRVPMWNWGCYMGTAGRYLLWLSRLPTLTSLHPHPLIIRFEYGTRPYLSSLRTPGRTPNRNLCCHTGTIHRVNW